MNQSHARPVELWISISRYAKLYGVSRNTVYKWLRAGLLEQYRVQRTIRVLNQHPRPEP